MRRLRRMRSIWLLFMGKGRIKTIRKSSSKLRFLDLVADGFKIQVMSSFGRSGAERAHFDSAHSKLKKGDIIAITGLPGRTKAGEISIYATELPQPLSPCLHVPPLELEDVEKRFQSRHVDLMVNPLPLHVLKARSFIINWMRNFFLQREFVEVSTPILAELSGGAAAKPFETASKVFGSDKKMQLRIAPELWLKRLVVGGLHRVFEIGPNFRNENADATHNPEFYTCEFYEAFTDIEGLKRTTTEMLVNLFSDFEKARPQRFPNIEAYSSRELTIEVKAPFREIDFIGGIEDAIGCRLPTLDEPDATERLLEIIDDNEIGRPVNCTLPGILDYLASEFLEPECIQPTFLTDIPACLSPLSKTSRRESDGQLVAHRAELYVGGKELANLYEEENSPFEQRRKFIEQNKFRAVAALEAGEDLPIEILEEAEQVLPEMPVDESYIGALEWGLPPTGGWGMGLDRLVMLLCNVQRIGDVMAFGGLRGTVLAGRGLHKRVEEEEGKEIAAPAADKAQDELE
ncbi:hypothetical protein TWF102_001742 [Orbilia oligospora]|uniref:Lysyl-tRNA synthetase n=1 Tax=Orbilia oligospora TaxID=2813651 RepID=A0A7C8N3U4_ORBOL|nr:hypothetical protein TWF102_001742 [Orbilia oligospora]KAF3083822.1 hypothetical protein TWF706_001094 [Orbilia oligospora]KAF3090222.1 hypothetical protein TWF103_011947 [Orbilia oligospora]